MSGAEDVYEITAEDLREMVRVLGLVPVPDDVMPRVLATVRAQRRAMRKFFDSGLDVSAVVPAQILRVENRPEVP